MFDKLNLRFKNNVFILQMYLTLDLKKKKKKRQCRGRPGLLKKCKHPVYIITWDLPYKKAVNLI